MKWFLLRHWKLLALVTAIGVTSILPVPAAQEFGRELRGAAACGLVPGGAQLAMVSGRLPATPGAAHAAECARLATRAAQRTTTVAQRLAADGRRWLAAHGIGQPARRQASARPPHSR